MDNEEAVQEVEESTNEGLFTAQSLALKRLIKNSGVSVTELGRKIGVQKQNLHIWMRGQAIIPEPIVKKIANFFDVHPAEIRYDVPAFNKEDLRAVVILLELFLESKGKELDPESKAKAIVYLYGKKQKYRRMMLKNFSESEFLDEVNEYFDTF